MTTESNWALHCIVRSDMASLNPGKAMAQVAHASSMLSSLPGHNIPPHLIVAHKEWHGKFGFGTTLVFGFKGNTAPVPFDSEVMLPRMSQSDAIVYWVDLFRKADCLSDVVIDPSYPIRDGNTTHVISNVLTVGWFFVDRNSNNPKIIRLLDEFRHNSGIILHP